MTFLSTVTVGRTCINGNTQCLASPARVHVRAKVRLPLLRLVGGRLELGRREAFLRR